MRDSANARFTAKVVLPTPPFPDPTATIALTPGRGWGPCGCPGCICAFKGSHSRKVECGARADYTGVITEPCDERSMGLGSGNGIPPTYSHSITSAERERLNSAADSNRQVPTVHS